MTSGLESNLTRTHLKVTLILRCILLLKVLTVTSVWKIQWVSSSSDKQRHYLFIATTLYYKAFDISDLAGSEDDLEEDPLMDERQPSHQGFQRIDAVETQPAQVQY